MTIRGRWLGVLVAALVAALTAGREARADTWTILYYSGADNDLESSTMEQWAELLQLNLNRDEVTVLLQMDRSPRGDLAGGFSNAPVGVVANWSGTRRFVVENHQLVELQDMGDPDATNPETLADFIRWGVTMKHSQHIVLVIGDHGGAWTGAVSDDTVNGMEGGTTTLDNIRAGIRLGVERASALGFTRFDVIAFDCCLMGNFEVAFALQPFGEYLVGAALAMNNSMSAETLARSMVDSFREWNLQARGSSNVAAVFNLTRLPALTASLATVAGSLDTDLMAGEDAYRKIAAARLAADTFGFRKTATSGSF